MLTQAGKGDTIQTNKNSDKCYITVTKCNLFVIEKIVYWWYNMERRPQDVVVANNNVIITAKALSNR